MSKVAITGNVSGTGTLTIAAPNTSTDRTLTLPDNTGTIITTASTFAGTGPAFSATNTSATQSFSQSTWSKVTFDTETFDTNSNFASSTFTPTVAGYYQINGVVYINGTNNLSIIAIYKNGSLYLQGNQFYSSGLIGSDGLTIGAIIYMNGTTDYLDLYVYSSGATPSVNKNTSILNFSGALVRAA